MSARLTMYITLAFVGLGDKEIGNVPADVIFVAYSIPPKNFLQPEVTSAISACHLREICNLRSRTDQSTITILAFDH
jgi:hypothetical protein